MDKEDFIVKILRIIAMSMANYWKLEDIVHDIERVIETFNMVKE